MRQDSNSLVDKGPVELISMSVGLLRFFCIFAWSDDKAHIPRPQVIHEALSLFPNIVVKCCPNF